MTVTSATSLLYLFRSKIEDAVGLVPGMGAEEKLKAVQFWNVVSEKLQEIVNNSAADINALALKMDEQNAEKQLSLDIGNEPTNNLVSGSNICSSDFINSPSNYTVCDDAGSQFVGPDISNNHCVVNYLAAGAALAGITENSLPKHLSGSLRHMEPLEHGVAATNSVTSTPDAPSDHFASVQTLSKSDCVTLSVLESCATELPVKENLLNSSPLVLHQVMSCNQSATDLPKTDSKQKRDQTKELNSNRTKSSTKSANGKIKSTKDVSVNSTVNVHSEQLSTDGMGSASVINGEKPFIGEADIHAELNPSSSEDSEKSVDGDLTDSKTELKKASLDDNAESSEEKPDDENLQWSQIKKPYLCTECHAQFSARGNLIVHLRRHTGEKPFSCSQCPARFSTKGNLKRHIKTHSGEKPWECNQCGTRFTEKKSLKVHMRRHTGEKPYQCQVCGKNFSQTGILQTHMAMHLDSKAHLCEHCGKSFRQKSQLRLHMLRHEGVKKFFCETCQARFLTKGDLERHTRVHTGERPFVCDLCGKSFTRQQSLNEHMNRHYGLKPYECKYCSRGFAEMSACYKHVKHHEKKVYNSEAQQPEDNPDERKSGSPESEVQQPPEANVQDVGYTVILHNTSQNVPSTVDSSIADTQDLNETVVIQTNSNTTNLDLGNTISDFTAINLLANASTHQQSF